MDDNCGGNWRSERVKLREMFAAYRPTALEGGNRFQSQGAAVSERVKQMYAAYRPSAPMP